MEQISLQKKNTFKNPIGLCFLGLYILFLYIAQEGLLPTALSSLTLYAFIGVSFLYVCINFSSITIPNFTIWYFVILTISFASFLYAEYFVFSAIYSMFVSLVLSFCILITVTEFKAIDLLANFYIWSSVAMSLLLLVTGQLILDVEEGERLGEELSGNANSFSSMVMLAAVFAAWYMVYKCNWKTRLFYIAAFVSLIFVMSLSGGRKNVIAVLICAVIFILFSSEKEKKAPLVRNLLICMVLLFAFIWAVLNIPVLYETIGERFEALFGEFFGLDTKSSVGSDKTREILVKIGLEGWKEAPIFGHGLDNFKYFNKTVTGHFYYAHNNYVELLYDVGLIGFATYYGFLVYMLVKLIKLPKKQLVYKILGLGLLTELAVYDFGGISFYTVFSIVILAIIYSIIKIAEGSRVISLK